MLRKFQVALALLLAVCIPSNTASAGEYRNVVVWALEEDASFWGWNGLDIGSYGPEVEQAGYNVGDHVLRMSYTYNGGMQGWVEVYVLNGVAKSIRYHDNNTWADIRVRNPQSAANTPPVAQAYTQPAYKDNYPNIPWGDPNQVTQCIANRARMVSQSRMILNQKSDIDGNRYGGSESFIEVWQDQYANTCGYTVKFNMACKRVGIFGDSFVREDFTLEPGGAVVRQGPCIYVEQQN